MGTFENVDPQELMEQASPLQQGRITSAIDPEDAGIKDTPAEALKAV